MKILQMNFRKIIKLVTCAFLITLLSEKLNSEENLIIFKINDNAYTSLDYKKRLEYLDFVNTNQDLSRKIVMNDFISVLLFYEYYKNNNLSNNYQNEIIKIYNNILQVNLNNNKKYKYSIDKENILINLELDYNRKIILENILNSNKNILDNSNEELDLLYEYKITYINFNSNISNKIIDKINNSEVINIENVELILKNNNIEYFIKNSEINNINNLEKKIKNNILNNNNFFILNNNQKISLIFLDKKFETLDGLIADIYSVRSEKKLNDEDLKCRNLSNLENHIEIINKEYKFSELNNKLKNNLLNVNDYIEINSNDEIIYIILCKIIFDKEKFQNYNLNKLINLNVNNIENEFIKKYSKIYNLVNINE